MKGLKFLFALAVLTLLSAVTSHAQSTTSTSTPLFSASTQAVALHLGGQTVAGTDLVGSFNLSKNNILSTHNILAPGIDFQGYYGAYRRNFSLDSLAGKTNIPKGMFQPYCEAMGGVVRNVPASGASTQSISAIADCGLDFDLTSSRKFTFGPRGGYIYAPGFGSNPHGVIISANLTFVLGSK